jgi:hypothetical protein
MKYEKPAVVEVAKAIEAVQNSTIKSQPPIDHAGMTTVAAYQSDEA